MLQPLCNGTAGLGMVLGNASVTTYNNVPPTELTALAPSKNAAVACRAAGLATRAKAAPASAAVVSAAAKPKPLTLNCAVTWKATLTNSNKVREWGPSLKGRVKRSPARTPFPQGRGCASQAARPPPSSPPPERKAPRTNHSSRSAGTA